MTRLLIAAFVLTPMFAFGASDSGNAGGAMRGLDRSNAVIQKGIDRGTAMLADFSARHAANLDAIAARQKALDARAAHLAARTAP